ncbi:MAG: bifunctional phosphoribosyl-AMP cyclohydrolase/phosphoribosyl-ATP diphosphatase HisIE [Gemmatimonadales bacterium]|nr:MAG: bifunctional phosphoribosyl-AMP cyclohydrolase/phosphoribosyl-ATP diphosphatase HisIE [Gemmatimonadales bacterium]
MTQATDRRLREEADLDALAWNKAGLVPVIAQEAETGAVLMLAWANREALGRALETGQMHYWSRSRKSLWRKGETSGHVQAVVSLHGDCDSDAVLARVRQTGPACHTGDATCFGTLPSSTTPEAAPTFSALDDAPTSTSLDAPPSSTTLDALWQTLEARAGERPEGSWTTRLLDDPNLRLKKLGEETVELVQALLTDPDRAPEEAADLVYHVMVALLGAGRSWDEVTTELERRRR